MKGRTDPSPDGTRRKQGAGKTGEGLFDPIDSKSVVDKIIDRISHAIITRELLPGQKIPTEAELCDSLKVGRNSVREAIKIMMAMGVLQIRRSEGTFITEGFSERMLDPMVYGLILAGGDSFSVIELRQLFETGILRLALGKRTDEDVADLSALLEDMSRIARQSRDENEILTAEFKFHRAINTMARNPLADKMSQVIERLTLSSRLYTVRQFIEQDALEYYIREHADIVRVIRERDDSAVVRIIDEHYRNWKDISGPSRAGK